MKKQGWERLLSEYLMAQAVIPFVWGESDCVHFMNEWVIRATDKNPAQSVIGQYNNEESARALAQSLDTPPDVMMDLFLQPVSLAFAQRGDICFKRTDDGFSFGIVDSGRAIFKVDGVGLVKMKLNQVDKVWRVD